LIICFTFISALCRPGGDGHGDRRPGGDGHGDRRPGGDGHGDRRPGGKPGQGGDNDKDCDNRNHARVDSDNNGK
jgi:hypothetical protein